MKNSLYEKLENESFFVKLDKIKGGRRGATEGTGECHGTGCSEQSGDCCIDWEDIECGDDNYDGSLNCPV